MSHFAEIKDGVVQRVIVAEQNFINSGIVGDSFNWIQCSYNNNYRKQYPGKGFTYDSSNDVFIAPQPYPSWTLGSQYDWKPPVAYPDDGQKYEWNEGTKAWDAV